MKTITFTDVEAAHVRRAVASLAGTDADGEHLRTALVKLDRGSDQRLVTIEVCTKGTGRWREVYRATCSRWTAKHAAIVLAVTKKGHEAVVRIDGSIVSVADLGINEAFS